MFLDGPTLALNFEILSYLNAEKPFIPLHFGVTLQQRLTEPALALDQFLYQVIIHRLVGRRVSVRLWPNFARRRDRPVVADNCSWVRRKRRQASL